MVRPPRFDRNGIKSGVWSKEEDDTLRAFVRKNGHDNWQKLPFLAGLARSGKSCRLRWVNYLQPGLKKSNFTKEEVDLIIRLHNQFGNKWSAIADHFPGRTDNDIKNHWHAHIKKRGKRCRLVTGAEMGHEEESFDQINCFTKSNHQDQETEAFNVDVFAQAENHKIFSMDVPPFPEEEEFNGLGLRHIGSTPTFSDSSYDDPTCFTQDVPPLISEEEFSDLELCHYDTPTSSDSTGTTYDDQRYLSCQLKNMHLPPFPEELSFDMPAFFDSTDGGITCDDYRCFSLQLGIDLPPLISEEEFCAFGWLCHNDTPTFSDSSDDHTCFTQLSIHQIAPFQEEEFSDFGVSTPTFFGSSDGGITSSNQMEVFGFSQLERAWYFGEDV